MVNFLVCFWGIDEESFILKEIIMKAIQKLLLELMKTPGTISHRNLIILSIEPGIQI